jgi:hypothetical protein
MLDLSVNQDRVTLNKLGRVSNFERTLIRMSDNPLLNTAQKGNGTGFRTEV